MMETVDEWIEMAWAAREASAAMNSMLGSLMEAAKLPPLF
jgi:hypothetical protein